MQSFYMTQTDKEAWVKQRMIDNRQFLWDFPLVLGLVMNMLWDAHTFCLDDKPRFFGSCCNNWVHEEYWTGVIPLDMTIRDPGPRKAIVMDDMDLKWVNRRCVDEHLHNTWPLNAQVLEQLGSWLHRERGKLRRQIVGGGRRSTLP